MVIPAESGNPGLGVPFGQKTLLLRLQVDAPLDRELGLLRSPLEHLDGLAVIHMYEFRADDAIEFRDQLLLDTLVEEARSSCPSIQQRVKVYLGNPSASAALSERSAMAISGSIYPQLGEVAAGVRVLGADGRPEGLDLGQCEA
jgi:hypothetical protein